jgi:hypothetical protein
MGNDSDVFSVILDTLNIGQEMIGGLAGTSVMDFILTTTLLAAGLSALTWFTIVGAIVACFFSIPSIETAGSIPLGVATHYLIGPTVGAIFKTAVVLVNAFRVTTLKKSILPLFDEPVSLHARITDCDGNGRKK